MSKLPKYLLVETQALPEVFERVMQAKELLNTGEAKNSTAAAKRVGLSRSAFYKYKDKVFKGASFPDAPIKNNVKISFTKEMINEYLPTIETVEASKGIKLLCIIMASKEGFYKGTRSYRCNNSTAQAYMCRPPFTDRLAPVM